MKRVIAIALLVLVAISASTVMSCGASEFTYKTSKCTKGYVTRFYNGNKCVGKVKTSKRLKVKVIESEKLTAKQLEHRKNKYILVEVVKGKCLNKKGDGRTSDGYYISYKYVKGHKRGDKYRTYCVYANNNYIDDVAFRLDVKRK